jgi:carbon-monoxide dehydrogenase large subunit
LGLSRVASARQGPDDQRARFVRGEGRFTADLVPAGAAHGVFLRAEHAHGEIRRIDPAAALQRPGVLAVLTGADLLAAGIGPIPTTMDVIGRDGRAHHTPPRHALAVGRVRHVGEPVCLVVARTRHQAEEAAAVVEVEIAPRPAQVDLASADDPAAPQIWPEAPRNIAIDWAHGDAAACAAAFARAAHVTRLRLRNSRVYAAPMEPRSAIADYRDGRYILIVGTQGVAGIRRVLATSVLRRPPDRVRVITPDVGGAFGMKTPVYPDYVALLAAARRLRRPVAWTGSRLEGFLADNHGRDGWIEAALALGPDSQILALHVRVKANMGAYLTHVGPYIPTHQILRSLASVYRTPVIRLESLCLFTNTAPVGPYRGAGRPEANLIMERLLDQAALESGIDRVALRRRNLIGEDAFPYRPPTTVTYDGGAFAQALDKALDHADWQGFGARRAASAARGLIRGRGLACYLEATGGAPIEAARYAFDRAGVLEVAPGIQAAGQEHAATLARLFADRLGIPPAQVRIVEGDSDRLGHGGGTVGSRSMTAIAPIVVQACARILEEGRALAAAALEAAADDLLFEAGGWTVAGTDRRITLAALAQRHAGALAGEVEAAFLPTFPNGCHVAEVEIDPETGQLDLVRFTAVDDVGTILNDAVVAGQVHGGIAQAAGQVMGEQIVYTAGGQLLTASFMDYPMLRAADLPGFRLVHHVVPATTNPLGVKGAGEGGTTGALPALVNAVADALASAGVAMIELPLTPERLWAALRGRPLADRER